MRTKDKEIKRAEALKVLEKHKMPSERHVSRDKFFEVCPQFADPFPEDEEDTRPIEKRKRPNLSTRWTAFETGEKNVGEKEEKKPDE